jgi:hypothetical protein
MKHFLLILLIALLAGACNKSSLEIKELFNKYKAGTGNSKIQVPNGNFEKSLDFNNPKTSYDWIKRGYIINAGKFTWDKKIGRNNGGGVSIETGGIINDLSITQEIVLNPTRFYRLSAWIKTENVEEGAGANVCLFGT